jgi:hypothetical protein
MSQQQTGWLALFAIALLLIIIGFQGNLGLVIGILFSPDKILIGDETDIKP